MKYKHVMAAHELRMWILTFAAGVAAANVMLAEHPEVKRNIRKPIDAIKRKLGKETTDEKEVIKIVIVKEE
jgi:hypothetical protein